MESFTVRGLSFRYPERTQDALCDLDFYVGHGELVALCGPSGCGKSTLLRQLKPALAPHGDRRGTILFEGAPIDGVSPREQSARIGFVMQDPDNQIVTDKVWHELAFGLESLGYRTPEIRLRVAEMASFFGIQTWFYKNVTELSGGQKQLLNLASIMAMQPSVLILDEPTSQLDPIAASDFLATVGKINRELGITVIITEHRLEEVFPMCDRALVMDGGRLAAQLTVDNGTLRVSDGDAASSLRDCLPLGTFLALPTPIRVWHAVPNALPCPVTVRDGARWLARQMAETGEAFRAGEETSPNAPTNRGLVGAERSGRDLPQGGGAERGAVRFDDVWFKYEKDAPDVVKGLTFGANAGEITAILGGNGAGKTTALSLISGANKPYRGKVYVEGRELSSHGDPFRGLLGVLPQNPQTLFVKKTVYEDLLEIVRQERLTREERERRIARAARLCRIETLLPNHPYDLSGGEQQRAALAKVLLLRPRILLLDEPTKGLDAEFKQIFAGILRNLTRSGATVILVSHDVEFCAEYADRCALFFDGCVVSDGAPAEFFAGNSFYTTAANRMARGLLPGAVTAGDIIAALGGTSATPPEPEPPDSDSDSRYEYREDAPHNAAPGGEQKRLPLWRKLAGGVFGLISLALAYVSLAEPDIPWLLGDSLTGLYIALLASLFLLALSVSRRHERPIDGDQTPAGRRKLPRRTVAAAAMILLAVPLTIYIGVFYLGDRKYYFIALMIILETMLPFALVFESRKPKARELVIISVLCAIGVAGRGAFFMLPQFKPVTATVIIAGVAFGGETGFLVGAVTMLTSNIMFGQGPWTPWQMFAMGVIGFVSGVLFRKGLLRRGRLPLCIFGGLATVIIYGGIMNPAYVIIYQQNPMWPMFLSAYVRGFPFDLVHAAATVFFLWFASRPMLEKLDRIKVKYGFVE
ncbi:MAG: ATP-binding cassette domain-containing protein [Oscillospiraceae bacterium]|jgi:energy-coupling factor transport system ATP-binding protein|nr:ATP-binding cassette domain-containing protein [Oscillospiraceae bacterium]